jgi:pyruvate kinase
MKYVESRTKIIATIGPASSPKNVLKKMIENGVDVCRLNFSHGTHEQHLKVIKTVREINSELGSHVALLADLQGPKLRIGELQNGSVELLEGHEFTITSKECIGTSTQVYLSYPGFAGDVKTGEHILIDDGKLKLEVIETDGIDSVKVKVIYGGILLPRKGVNLPHTKVSLPSLTKKDLEDLNFALDHNVDWVALSFVRNASDIQDIKKIIHAQKKSVAVIAKIEKPEALKEIDHIISVSDGIMVARGDLGVEVDFWEIPLTQKQIIAKCLEASKPVIVATQMMESMITNFRPTRAEATDVANAVIDGADTLMLSGETSTGKFPVEVIQSMHSIIQWTEDHGYNYCCGNLPKEQHKTFIEDSICFNAAKTAGQIKAKAIITFTHSGYTSAKIASYRPEADIFAFTSNKTILARMSLLWGIRAMYFDLYHTIDDSIEYSINTLKEKGYIKPGDMVIHVASMPLAKKEKTNMLKISCVS